MEKAASRYGRFQRSEGMQQTTVSTNQIRIAYFIAYVRSQGLSDGLEGLSVSNARGWIEAMQDKGLSDWTINTRIRSLKAFSNWLYKEEWIDHDPLAKLRPPKAQDVPKHILDPKDVERLLATCPTATLVGLRDRAIITLLYSTGIRLAELVALQKNDIDYKQGLVLVRRGKGGKVRVVPLGQRADKAIDRYLAKRKDDRPELFLTDEGEALGYWTVRMLFRRKSEAIGRHVHPHLFRHSFAVQYLRNGGKLETLKAIMGHSDYETTLHYARLAGVDVLKDHDIADPMRHVRSDTSKSR